MALTDTECRVSRSQPKAYKLYDRDGLFLLINPNASKLWRFKYTFQGKEKLMAMGEYPLVKLADARERTFKARRMLADGIDPMGARKAAKIKAEAQAAQEQRNAENSFQAVALKWQSRWAKGVDTETASYILRRLEADVFPVLGKMEMNDIKPAHIRKLILAIEKRGARDVAQRQHGTISQIFRYAVTHDLAERNPAADFKPSDVLSPRKTQHRAHIEPQQLPAFLVDIDNFNGHTVWKYSLQLMSMLFVRTNELLEAPLTEFDLDNSRWIIPPERMKMNRPHIVPLPRQAVVILRGLFAVAKANNKQFVFPGMNAQTANGTLNENTLLNALEDIGYKSIHTGHGFRGLASTILHENGFEDAHIDLQLGHAKKNKTAASYDHAKYIPQRTELMQWWADYLDAELAKGRAKIVPIRQSAA